MIEFLLQWGGSLLILIAYITIPSRPLFGWSVNFLGCVACFIWAIGDQAWGIMSLEFILAGVGIRNIYGASR